MKPNKSSRIHRRLLLGAAMVATCAALSCGVGHAADVVSLTSHEKNGTYDLQGSFQVDAEPSVIWDVLTGYQRIPRFVGSMKKSEVGEELGPYHFLLEQEFEGGFLFFTKRVQVLLDVHEAWYQAITFADTGHKDFDIYQGSWEIKPDTAKGQDITYTLEARPNFSTPFTGDVMHGGAKDLLEAVRREILRCQAEKTKAELAMTPLSVQTPGPGERKN